MQPQEQGERPHLQPDLLIDEDRAVTEGDGVAEAGLPLDGLVAEVQEGRVAGQGVGHVGQLLLGAAEDVAGAQAGGRTARHWPASSGHLKDEQEQGQQQEPGASQVSLGLHSVTAEGEEGRKEDLVGNHPGMFWWGKEGSLSLQA